MWPPRSSAACRSTAFTWALSVASSGTIAGSPGRDLLRGLLALLGAQ